MVGGEGLGDSQRFGLGFRPGFRVWGGLGGLSFVNFTYLVRVLQIP